MLHLVKLNDSLPFCLRKLASRQRNLSREVESKRKFLSWERSICRSRPIRKRSTTTPWPTIQLIRSRKHRRVLLALKAISSWIRYNVFHPYTFIINSKDEAVMGSEAVTLSAEMTSFEAMTSSLTLSDLFRHTSMSTNHRFTTHRHHASPHLFRQHNPCMMLLLTT